MSVKLFQIIHEIESIAPLYLQESYDNSGLLVGNKNQSYSQTPVNSSNQLPQSDSLTVSNDTKTEINQEVDAN
jgi:hypothetical protein